MRVTVPGNDPSTASLDIRFRRFGKVIKCEMFDNFLSGFGSAVCTFRGISKCHQEDDFSWETGKIIAATKAFEKRAKIYSRLKAETIREIVEADVTARIITLNKIKNNRR